MLYKFKSAASGDVIMLGPQGDQLLALLGRTPAAKGIIEVADMPAAVVALEAAIAGQSAGESADSKGADGTASAAAPDDDDAGSAKPVGLKARLWPMIDMLRRSQAAGEPVVWGV